MLVAVAVVAAAAGGGLFLMASICFMIFNAGPNFMFKLFTKWFSLSKINA